MFIVRLLGNEILDELPRSHALGKQSVAKLRNNRTEVLSDPFLGNGSINTLLRTTIRIWEDAFSLWSCRGVILKTNGVTQAVSSFQVNTRRSEQINSGTSGGSKRGGTRSTEEYRRFACEDVNCD
jgi:hypothetical protein